MSERATLAGQEVKLPFEAQAMPQREMAWVIYEFEHAETWAYLRRPIKEAPERMHWA